MLPQAPSPNKAHSSDFGLHVCAPNASEWQPVTVIIKRTTHMFLNKTNQNRRKETEKKKKTKKKNKQTAQGMSTNNESCTHTKCSKDPWI